MTASILLIEDDVNLRRVLQVKLSRSGFEVHAAESGQAAISLARKNPPRIIVCDYRLPDTTAVELASSLRSISDAPLLLITAYEDPSTQPDIERMAPVSVLYKPFDLDQLVDRIRAALTASTHPEERPAYSEFTAERLHAERRSFPRHRWVTDAIVAAAGSEAMRAATCDIGMGGLAVVANRALDPGDRVTVDCAVQASAESLRTQGRVVHCIPVLQPQGHKTYRIGIAFDSLPESAQTAISRWTKDRSPA